MTATVDREGLRRARDDVEVFARLLVGQPLWPHQGQVARSSARIRCMCLGRRAGKSRTLAVLALHEAFRGPERRVLLVSAGEEAGKDLLAEASALASSPLLAGSVIDDDKTILTLSNGSTIRSVPQSEKQIRGKPADLLIIDEAAYVDDAVWKAAQWTTLDRPGSRIILSSTPRGRRDRFFARLYHMAKDGPVEEAGVTVESFHWPSTVSPLVDKDLIEFWRSTEDPRTFAREVEALWIDEAGQYFTEAELDSNVAPFELLRPGVSALGQLAVAGIDWGATVDSNAVAVLGVLRDGDLNPGLSKDEPLFGVVFAEERFGSMNGWAREVAGYADPDAGGFDFHRIASEANGVGGGPTELLQESMRDRDLRSWRCSPVWTTNQRKQSGFGAIKLLLQQNRLLLPAEPLLRRQLEALAYETMESGSVAISVPETKGHDDVAMALMAGVSCLRHVRAGRPGDGEWGEGELVESPAGVRVFERPKLANYPRAFRSARGDVDEEKGW